jgi:hypothetical protein
MQDGGQNKLIREPLKLKGLLEKYKSFNVTPAIGKEFPDANVVEWMKAPNSDELLRDLAITSKDPNPPLARPHRIWLMGSSLSSRRGVLPRANRLD